MAEKRCHTIREAAYDFAIELTYQCMMCGCGCYDQHPEQEHASAVDAKMAANEYYLEYFNRIRESWNADYFGIAGGMDAFDPNWVYSLTDEGEIEIIRWKTVNGRVERY